MSDLAEFLLARIAEDEAAARESRSTLLIANLDACAVPGSDHEATLRHHERWEPRRVLAECEAKRRIIELAEEASVLDGSLDAEFSGTIGYKGGGPDVGDRILLALALPYADHADYREEWRAE